MLRCLLATLALVSPLVAGRAEPVSAGPWPDVGKPGFEDPNGRMCP